MKPTQMRGLIEARWPEPHVASTSELAAAGIDHRVLTEAVRRKELVRLRRGVYVRRAYWLTLAPWDQERLRIEAHWLSTQGGAVYSHATAARILGCRTWGTDASVHVTVPYSGSKTSHGADVRAHSLYIPDEDIVPVRLGPGRMARSTSLERSVADVARILDPERAAIIGDHALRLGASLDGIRAAAERSGAARGARRIENLLGLLDGLSESPGETRTRFALAAAGLPTPVLQHRIETSEGQYRADFAWPDLLVVLEFDGDAKYFDYRPTQEVLLAERRRELALVAEGWTVARVRWADLSVPGHVASTVLSAFERARKLAA
ncbi:type IV toxin-antitoxin system AbiEi family antitoxin domain-containing protein [Sinomonas mesophila]|uniref:type IV toxin-antitoxin system AbiEi family antitoxin domain-containing protein n=1 Tax=Sinomonas mesophila TaxID=1531955 RepID=UPI0009854E5D|nr:type IV toxin-antitoxin system AbiEi family antitoxin domain-containing protein [Sinomonas mesophila]